MKKRQYNIITISLLCLYYFGPALIKIIDGNAIFVANFSKTFSAIATLLFGVYFYFSVFKKEKEIIAPIVLIFIGIFHLIPVLGSTFTSYNLYTQIGTYSYKIPNETLEKLKEMAIVASCPDQPNTGKMRAKTIFNETGEKIDYLNENGSIVIYSPTKEDIIKRNKKISQERKIQHTRDKIRKIALVQLITVVLSICLFVVSFFSFPPNKVTCNT